MLTDIELKLVKEFREIHPALTEFIISDSTVYDIMNYKLITPEGDQNYIKNMTKFQNLFEY
jgi:hypothetical protein